MKMKLCSSALNFSMKELHVDSLESKPNRKSLALQLQKFNYREGQSGELNFKGLHKSLILILNCHKHKNVAQANLQIAVSLTVVSTVRSDHLLSTVSYLRPVSGTLLCVPRATVHPVLRFGCIQQHLQAGNCMQLGRFLVNFP